MRSWDSPIWAHKPMIFLRHHKHSAGKMRMNRSKITLSNKLKSSNCGETEKTSKYHNLLTVWWWFLSWQTFQVFSLHKAFYHISRSCISHPLLFPVMCSFFGSSCTSHLALQTSVLSVISISPFAALILFGALNSSRTCMPAFPWDCSPSINSWSTMLATSLWWVNETVWSDGTAHVILRQCATQWGNLETCY